MYRNMEICFILYAFLLIWIVSVECTSMLSCPTNCTCRGKASRCTSGFTAFPQTFDASVEYLAISGSESQKNTITTIGKANLQRTGSLFTLVITYSDVHSVEDEAFDSLTNLHDLSLANNDIQNLKAETFKGLLKLRTLDLSGNINCKFDKNMLTYITDIEELNIGNMNIRSLEKDFFASTTKLKVLKLYTNGIKELHQDLFAPLQSLDTLDLNGNLLSGLPVELKPMFKAMKNVHFSDNPWQCNCQLLWLRELPASFVASRTDTSEIVCNGPSSLKYNSFVNVPESKFTCIPPKVVRCEQTRYSLDVNHRLTISCEFQGDPVPEVKWVRADSFEIDGKGTAKGKYEILGNGTLLIDSVDTTDDGDWTVTAYNSTAHGDLKINVHVIITTTSTTTTSTSTTTTTTSTTTTPTTTTGSTVRSTQSIATSSTSAIPTSALLSRKSSANTPLPTQHHVTTEKSTKIPDTKFASSGNSETVIKDNGINYGLVAAGAAGGGTIVGIITITAWCITKKKGNQQTKISPFQDGFDF